MEIDVKHLMKHHAAQNVPLNYNEAYALGQYVIQGCNGDPLAQVQSIALMSALHNKALYAWQWNERQSELHEHRLPLNAAEQIAGICAAVFEHDIKVSEFGYVQPDVPCVMDNCGMGGDLVLTANISTLAALIAATAGIPMCKHGSPANADQGRYGSSDFVSLICGINTMADKQQVEHCVAEHGFGYTEALDTRYKHIHLQTHDVARLPHMSDIIGPITNPIHPHKMRRRMLGVNHLIAPRVVAEVYNILNEHDITRLEHGLFVRGFTSDCHYEGIDEISICRAGTAVAELKDGVIREYTLTADDFGLKPIDTSDIVPIGQNKGAYSWSILTGQVNGSRLDIVLANAAALMYLGGKAADFKSGCDLARQTFASGMVMKTVENVKSCLGSPA